MFSKKAQGTVEYLIILAVIIVIALVVVGVMGWFPGMGTGITEQQSRAYWKSASPLAITDWHITSSNGTFTLQNMTTDTIQLNDLTVAGTALGLADVNIAAGTTYTTAADSDITCTSGKSYSYSVSISYDIIGGISGKTQTGAKPIVGTCP